MNNLKITLLAYLIIIGNVTMAQVSGNKNIPGDYATIAAALTDLNTNGVGSGGATINIAAGFAEAAPSGGLSLGSATLNASLSLTNQLIIQKSGTGVNPLITAYVGGTGVPTSATQDGIFRISGSDYVTIDGIDLIENGSNSTNPSTMEYGYALYKASATDGCQNVTIRNCAITLNRINNVSGTAPASDGSTGIIVMNATATAATTNLTVTAASGANSNNKFYSNTIQNCHTGIAIIGFGAASPYTLGDTGNDIGGNSLSTGNNILNFGGAPGSAIAAAGIRSLNQWSLNVSYNTVNNNNGAGLNHPNILRGIYINTAAGANTTITYNNVTVKGAGTTQQVTAIENASGSTAASNTVNISNNSVTDCSYSTATSGVFYGIYNTGAPFRILIRNNTLTNDSSSAASGSYYPIYNTGSATNLISLDSNQINGIILGAPTTSLVFRGIYNTGSTTATTLNIIKNNFQGISYSGAGSGETDFIYNSGTNTNININNNTFTSISINTSGTAYFIYNSVTTPATFGHNINGNNIVTSFSKTLSGGTVYFYYNNGSSVTGTLTTSQNNNFSNVTLTGATILAGWQNTDGGSPNKNIHSNIFSNITGGTGALVCVTLGYGTTTNYYNNQIFNVTGAGNVMGTSIQSSGTNYNVYNNTIYNLSGTGAASTVIGIQQSIGTTNTMYGNKIYDLQSSGASGIVYGLNFTGGTTYTTYNNLIGNLRATTSSGTNQVVGINITGGTTHNIYFNTVRLNASSTGANFGTSAISVSTSPTVTLRNNIFINNSTPAGTGFAVAYRRSSTTLTTYGASSNNNIFYAGTPGTANLIFNDGTNSDQTIAAFKSRVSTRDAGSLTENTTFLDITGATVDFLHPDPTIPTFVESGAVNIAGITTDFDGNTRQGNPGYSGSGSQPDIGADEGAFLPIVMVYDSSNVDQNTTNVLLNTTNQAIIAFRVHVSNSASPLSVNSIKFNTAGTTSVTDITNARVYYTGSSSTFATTTPYGTAVASPNGTFYATGSRMLNNGANYFWLAYDVPSTATPNNLIDARVDSVLIGSTNYSPLNGDPAGGRQIQPALVDSSNVDQISGVLLPNTTNQQIFRIRVYTSNNNGVLNATSFKFNTSGTTDVNDISNAKLFYTGATGTFSATTQFGSTTAAPNGTFYATGSSTLLTGINYFWLTYDIKSTATLSNLVDARLDSILVSSINYTPINGDPAGSRNIVGPLLGNYNIGSGQVYTTITAAVADLNSRGVGGPVTFTLTDATYPSETFPIVVNQFSGASATNTVTLMPATGITSDITATVNAPLFDLNGADYFRIDGRQNGTGAGFNLTIQNNNTGATSSAVRFINDATNNNIVYTTLKGSTTTAANGVVLFSTGISTGNDRNMIDTCNIGDGTSLPTTLISSQGSTTDSTVMNSSIIINRCQLFNYWNAAAECNAFKLSSGTNSWIISNNHIYQTAPRTATGTVQQYPWNLQHSGNFNALNNMQITGNYVGGSAPYCGGTPWTVSGGTASCFSYVRGGNLVVSNFSNNTLTNFNLSTAATATGFPGLWSAAWHLDGMYNMNGNTIGSLTDSNAIVVHGTGTTGATFGICMAGTTAGTYSFSNNKIGGMRTTVAAATSYHNLIGISISGATNTVTYVLNNNTIGNVLPDNMLASTPSTSTTSQNVIGIQNTSSANLKLLNNTIRNLRNNVNAATSAGFTHGISTTAGIDTITGNTIYNLVNASPSQLNTDASASVNGIHIASATSGNFISQNTIYNLMQLNTAGSTVTVNGINTTSTTNSTISGNLIHSLTTSASGTNSSINGVNFVGGTNTSIFNNMIRLGIDSFGSALVNTPVITGFNKKGGNIAMYFNSIYLGGTGVGTGVANTYAFNRTVTGNDSLLNNIFVNERSNASTGGSHFCISINNNTTLLSNANIYWGSGAGASVGRVNTTGATTLNAWKILSGVDASSGFGDPNFVSPTGNASTINLHVSGTTPAEAAGIPVVKVTTDFDGQLRSSVGPTDIGADAGNFTAQDIFSPVISLVTTITNTSSVSNRTLVFNISDATAVPLTGGVSPILYYKKSAAGSYNTATGSLTGGTRLNGSWSFVISAAAMSGLTNGDSVYLYVVAQDSTASANVSSLPAGVEATSVTGIINPPATLLAYKILPGLSGNINIGASQTYTSLTGTGGAFDMINNSVLDGNITLTITSDLTETGTVALNTVSENGGSRTITIVPDAAIERTISGAVGTTGMIRMNGADKVIFDGRFAGLGRYLKFVNNNTTGPVFNFLNDAHSDTVRYCTILGNNTSSGNVLFSTTNVSSGTGNDSNAIMNCIFRDTISLPTTHINSTGTATAGLENSSNTISNNEFSNFSANGINVTATGNGNEWVISNNAFYQTSSRSTQLSVIRVSGGNNQTISGNSIGGSAANRSGAPSTTTTTTGTCFTGILINTTGGTGYMVSNNTIANIFSNTNGTDHSFVGIDITGPSGTITGNTIGGGVNPYDTVRSDGDSKMIRSNGGGVVTISNNLVAFCSNQSVGNDYMVGIEASAGTTTIINNTVRDITQINSTSTFAAYTCTGISLNSSTGNNIASGNTVYNIVNRSSAVTSNFAIGIGKTTASTNPDIISGNRIYNISALNTNTGTSSAIVSGIYVSAGVVNAFNNQISLGGNMSNESRIAGIRDESTGTNNYFYNSIFINGSMASGNNNSYGIFRNTTSTLNVRNNIFYNKRTNSGSATGIHLATGSATATGITVASSNYNLLVVNDTSRISEFPSTITYGVDAYNNSLYTPSGTYNTNWMESPSNLPAQTLFTDTATGNLGIVTTNANSWYVNGKGIPLAGYTGDYANASGVRSTSLSAATTDIGSVEFNTATAPPSALASAAPALNATTNYSFANRRIASLAWGGSGTVPTSVDVKFYSGVVAPNLTPSRTQFNSYINTTPTGGSGYTYQANLIYDSVYLGNVSGSVNARLAQYGAPSWYLLPSGNVNPVAGTISGGAIHSVFGVFTGTDISNPLPVQLLSFEAKANGNDVALNWITASELNNKGFEIERSSDGIEFSKVKFVEGKGNTNKVSNYLTLDIDAFLSARSNTLYYRLKQLDADGSFSYSNIVSVSKSELSGSIVLYPNPFNRELHIAVKSSKETSAVISMIDIQGRELYHNPAQQIHKGENTISIDMVANLKAGIYFISIQTGEETRVIKAIKAD